MLRKLSGLTAIFIFVCSAAASAQLDIGFVNTQEVMSQLPERQQIQQQMNTFAQQKEQELRQASTDFQNAVATYRQSQSTMTQQQIEQRETELTQMEQNLTRMQQTFQQEIVQKRQELLGPIYARIDQAIQTLAEENNLDYVFSEVTSSGSNIVYYSADSTMDLTQQVIQRVNSQSQNQSGNSSDQAGNN